MAEQKNKTRRPAVILWMIATARQSNRVSPEPGSAKNKARLLEATGP
jgi:hypothetical protein